MFPFFWKLTVIVSLRSILRRRSYKYCNCRERQTFFVSQMLCAMGSRLHNVTHIQSRPQGPRPPWLAVGKRFSRPLVNGDAGSGNDIETYLMTDKAFSHQFKLKCNSVQWNRIKQKMKTQALTKHKDGSQRTFPGRHFRVRNDSKIVDICYCISAQFIACLLE